MFFIMGISSSEKKLDFVQTFLCSRCGQFGRLELYMTYTFFSLFFIPVFRWNVRYYVKNSCCGTVYELASDLGKRLKKGENITITEQDLHMVSHDEQNRSMDSCPNCGYRTNRDFMFCPKCGKKL